MPDAREETAQLKQSLVELCDAAIAYMLQVKQGYHLFRPETYDQYELSEQALLMKVDEVCNKFEA